MKLLNQWKQKNVTFYPFSCISIGLRERERLRRNVTVKKYKERGREWERRGSKDNSENNSENEEVKEKESRLEGRIKKED